MSKYTSSTRAYRKQAAARYAALLKFSVWLDLAKVTDDPAGDLIADIRRDPRFPRHVSSEQSLKRALPITACDGAAKAVPQVWRRYTQWREAREREQDCNPHWLEQNDPTYWDVP